MDIAIGKKAFPNFFFMLANKDQQQQFLKRKLVQQCAAIWRRLGGTNATFPTFQKVMADVYNVDVRLEQGELQVCLQVEL